MKHLFLFITFGFVFSSEAQLFPAINYPAKYFRNPMGIPLQLSANFGELRTNHYHMGFDIRTNQRENLPVYAAAEGYISRVKIERYGFGRAIYVNHPNGYTTLYAHLNNFYDPLNSFVKDKQYLEEQWEQDIVFAPGQFPVLKGQFIANSGNTGGSAGPHLHFEIRDTKTENNLNPWLFNFNLADNIAPYIFRLFYYDRRYSTYEVGPKEVKLKKAGTYYSSVENVVVLPTPAFSVGITAEDKTNTSPFLFGIYQAELFIDDTARFGFRLNDFSYSDSRSVNGATDYKTKINGGPYIQHLSRLPGNNSKIFAANAGDGVYIITDTLIHSAEINVYDAAGNKSVTRFRFRYDSSGSKAITFASNTITMLPNQQNELTHDEIKVNFPPSSFYHTVPFVHIAQQANTLAAASKGHLLHTIQVPVNDSFTVKIKTSLATNDPLRNKVVMQLLGNDKKVATKGTWEDDWMVAKFWDLGKVQLLTDTIPPTIVLAGWRNNGNLKARKSLSFTIRDDVGEIKIFKALLDGKWLMFRRKSYSFIHDFDERTSEGKHELQVLVEDQAGNITNKTYIFTR